MYLSEKDKERIISFLRNRFKVKLVYLFGSFSRGEGREDSDIDLAIYTDEIIDNYILFTAGNELAFEVKRDIQIVNLKEISTVFAAQIVGTKEVLYCEDKKLMATFDIRTFKDYAKLNEERKVILDVIEKDGRIYG